MTSEASPISQMRDKLKEGLGALRAFTEALSDLSAITETLIEDLEFSLRSIEMDESWARVLPEERK